MTFAELSKEKGFSPSYTRQHIYDFLNSRKTHPTADDIYNAIKPNLPTLSKTTVYNVLKLFLEKGICKRIIVDANEGRYETDTFLHSHFICNKCNNIYDIPNIETKIKKDNLDGFVVHQKDILLRGICPSCQIK
jgi:Fe2+ or Zn2+ uptake regulation protein